MPASPDAPLTSAYPESPVNAPLILYSGPLQFDFLDGLRPGSGTISHSWFPSSNLLFEFTEKGTSNAIGHSGGPLAIPGFAAHAATRMYKAVGAEHFTFTGMIDPIDSAPDTTIVSHVDFHFANLPVFQRAIRHDWTYHPPLPHGRVLLQLAPWQLVIDVLPNPKEREDELYETGGFAITHAARLEHMPTGAFTIQDFRAFSAVTRAFLSLAVGRWVQPIFPVAFDASGREVWRSFDRTHTDRWSRPGSWLAYGREWALRLLFPRFVQLWNSPTWSEPLQLSIYWYVAANNRESGVEAALILQQVILELMAWVTVVADRSLITASEFEALPAADKIRRLLAAAGVTLSIPTELQELSNFALSVQAIDGPDVLTRIRNKFVHPKPTKTRRLVITAPPEIMHQAWTLGMWYLDILFLWLLNHRSCYASRLKGGHEDLVPWGTPPSNDEYDVA